MKNILLTLILCAFGVTSLTAQNAGVSGTFMDFPIIPGQTTQLIMTIAPDAFNSIAIGDLEVIVSFPASGSYVGNYGSQPTGTMAGFFSWTPNLGMKTWYGINNMLIPSAINGGGGTVVIDVTGVILNTQDPTALGVSLVGDINSADDNATPSLLVPVKLSSFNMRSSDCDQIALEWITETETNNKGFEVERSTDDRTFEKIGFVPAGVKGVNGSFHYSFVDSSVKEEKTNTEYFYRLVQVDLNGRERVIGSVLYANLDCREEFEATIYPIPAYSSLTYKLTNNYLGQNIDIMIYSNDGTLVHKSQVERVSLLESQIDVSKLAEGMYQIVFVTENNSKEYKFIKMK